MAATELIPVAATAANSSDFTLASGESATVFLKGVTGDLPSVFIEIKDDANGYRRFGVVRNVPIVIDGPGTFRARRAAGATGGVSRG